MGTTLRSDLSRELEYEELDANFAFFKSTPQAVVISNGVITVNGVGIYIVQPESGTQDEVTRINGLGTEYAEFRSTVGVLITFSHSANLRMVNEAAFTLEFLGDAMHFRGLGSDICADRGRFQCGLGP